MGRAIPKFKPQKDVMSTLLTKKILSFFFTFNVWIAGREHRLPGVHGCPLRDVERHPGGKPEVEILALYTVIQGPLLKVLSSNHV